MAISKPLENDLNNIMVIPSKFPGGWQFQSAQWRMRTMWWLFVSSSQVGMLIIALLREGFKQCDGYLYHIPRWIAILKPLKKYLNKWWQFISSSHADGNFEALGEEFERCDVNLYGVPRLMAISKFMEKDLNNVTAIQMKFPVGRQFQSSRRRIRMMWQWFISSFQVGMAISKRSAEKDLNM